MSLVRRSNLFPSSFFDDFLTRDLFDWSGWTKEHNSVPRVNIRETDNDFQVELAAPGLNRDHFQVTLENDMLTIHAEQKEENLENDQNQNYSRREFAYYSFKRSFYLPNSVETDKIKAKYENGILYLQIPKKEEARKKPVRTIKIS